MPDPTNAVLAEKIDNLNTTADRIEKHVIATNGNVKLNTEHRITQKTHNKWMYVIVVAILIPVAFLIFKSNI